MAKKVLTGNLNLSKIDKANLFRTESGTVYLDFKVVFNDEIDKYGNIAFIAQTYLTENRKDINGDYVKTPILGNLREIKQNTSSDNIENSSDLPF